MTDLPILAAESIGGAIIWVLVAILGLVVLVAFIIVLTYLKLWLKAVASHAPVGFTQFIGMFFRGIQASTIVDFRIKAVNAGIQLGVGEMQNFYLATGRDRNCIPVVVSNLIRSRQAGVDIAFKDLCRLYLQGGNVAETTQALIQVRQAGLDVPFDRFLQHHMAGGRVVNVAEALISAHRAKIPIDFAGAAQIDLAGRDVVDAVHTTVKPKVIDCPDPNRGVPMLDAVAKDGIRLLAKARVTVRTNIERVIGGATQETIIARVGEGIVSAIGSTATYKDVLENPDKLSRRVLDNSLDSQTAYEIVSIDIADISVAGV
ncbi:MAG: flotillin-like FloA family protein, partial [Planctomycetota bacterium]